MRIVVSCDVFMKIYQTSTEMEANDLKIYQKQKISGNLKKLQQKFMKSFIRTCDVSFEGQFVSNLTMSLNHPMDRCIC